MRGNPRRTVAGYMHRHPVTIGIDQPMARAHELMRTHHIRHLPVLSGGRLAGMVTDRDHSLVEGLTNQSPAEVTVEEAMNGSPYCITPDSSLEWVALEMAQHKHDAAVILDRERVVGVFTTVDALAALSELLGRERRRRASSPHPHA